MAEDTTNVDDRATHIPDHWVTLDKAPQQLPPIGEATFGHLTNDEHPEYSLPVLIPAASGFSAPVDARTVYRALVDHLQRWQRKGFVQPANAGARWHLQFRDVQEKPEPEPGILEAILPGFRVLILPGEAAPRIHSFNEPSAAMPGELQPPYVRITVTRRHNERCDATMRWTPQAGDIVADDLMARARDLWGELGRLESAPVYRPIPIHGLKVRREMVRDLVVSGMQYKDVADEMRKRGFPLMDWETVKRDVTRYLRPRGYLTPIQ